MADGADRDIDRRERDTAAGLDPRLQIWLAPSFPAGAFAYSHGLEWAAAAGWISDRATLEAWLRDLIAHGSLRNDMILLAASARAIVRGRLDEIADINALALAHQPSAERHLETVQTGTSFLATIVAAWPFPAATDLHAKVGDACAYPVAVGIAVGGHGIKVRPALVAYGAAFVGNLASAAIRLSLIGQTDAQRITAALLPAVTAAADRLADATLDDLGGGAFRSDLASIAHETQTTRLFRS